MAIEVTLLKAGTTPDPLVALYTAFRVDYSKLTPREVIEEIESGKISREQMHEFIDARFETGHASPLQQVYFEFGVSGVSRAFSHQFVRHHVGIDIEQQSQRYVTYKSGEFPYTIPETVKKAGMTFTFEQTMDIIARQYERMVLAGIPAEDARFVLPNATNTNLKFTVNFLELQHMADLRLCTRAQWEFRHMMAKVRGCIMRKYPWLGKQLGPKCMAFRMGYCDETKKDWAACPLSKVRPHRSEVIPA